MRNCGALLLIVTAACSNAGGEDAGSIANEDASVRVTDATIVDVGTRYDGGVVPEADAGFGDPATLIDNLITIAGARTYVRVRGTTTSTMPALLVLNTGPMMGHEYLVEPLDFLLGPGGREDPNRLILFYDMRATGRSGFGSIASSTITIDAHVSDLVDVLDWFDGFAERSGPVDVLAHGYGAAVATLFAVEHPERFRHMVYVTPYPSNILEQADYGATINNRLNTGDRERLSELSQWNYCLRDIPRCSRDAWNIVGPTWLCQDRREIFDTMTFQYLDMRAWIFFVNDDLRMREFDFRPSLEQVSHPVTLISGPCDAIPASTAASYASHLPNVVHHVLPNAGHFPMTEDPAGFQRIVQRALSN